MGVIKNFRLCRPLTTPINPKRISAFDIETEGKNNNFVCGSIVFNDKRFNRYGKDELKTVFFDDKTEMINYFKSEAKFKHPSHWVFAHNLYFDITSLLKDTDEIFKIKPLELHGSFIKVLWKINEKDNIRFYDTLSHAKISLANIGRIIGLEKGEKPVFLGEKPKDKAEAKILKEYNIRDSLICYKFAENLQNNYNNAGCNLRITLPSTAMDLYRRKYMDGIIKQPPRWVIDQQYNAMRGGRTEVIRRGKIEDCKLYDVRSMYPTMMTQELPHPNYLNHKKYDKHKWRDKLILEYEGVSNVEMRAPYNHIPYLPVRCNNKLVFPYGYIRGSYTHLEIRKALEHGYELLNVKETFYYTRTHTPFRDFVMDMYGKRIENIKNRDLNLFYKLIMNSLYGKFAQKINRGNQIRPFESFTPKEFLYYMNNPNCSIDINNDWVYYGHKKQNRYPIFINPIYSIYITAKARNYLYDLLPKDTYYMDTDSFITKEDCSEYCGPMLGELELQEDIKEGILVRPKMYSINEKTKIKGCPKATFQDFNDFLAFKHYGYLKMSKYRESIRKNIGFNSMIEVKKKLSLEDDKRVWKGKFDPLELQESEPIKLTVKDY